MDKRTEFVDSLKVDVPNEEELLKDLLDKKYEEYANFSDNTRKSRLSSAKSIFRRGLAEEALRIISSSGNVPFMIRSKAEKLLNSK